MDKNIKGKKEHSFTEESPFSDVTLVVEGKKLFVHKAILALVSPVFKTMFFSDFKEKYAKEVPLPEKNYDDVVSFLKHIYPNIKAPLTLDIVVQVLPLFHEYDCKHQILECEEFLTANVLPNKINSQNTLLKCLAILKTCDLQKTFEHCLNALSYRTACSIEQPCIVQRFPDYVKASVYLKTLQNSCRFTNDLAVKIKDQVIDSINKLCYSCQQKETTRQLRSIANSFYNETQF